MPKPTLKRYWYYPKAEFPLVGKYIWCVRYPGKKAVVFERWIPAMIFAVYVFRNPCVMQDEEK